MSKSHKLSSDWNHVLARVEQALSEAVRRLEQREQALAAHPTARPAVFKPDFTRFEEGMANLARCTKPSDRKLADVDTGLRESEDAVRAWLARADATRRRLAHEEGRAVR